MQEEHTDLFPPLAISRWLPDETLFSLVSRHHRLSANSKSSTTCLQVFGHVHQGSAHDFPSRIDEFAKRTQGRLGRAEDIIQRHTLLPFYLPFRSAQVADDAYTVMRGSGIGSLKYRLGILTSRFRAHHPLKACSQCMMEDREKWGVAYWRRDHQWPGTWVCTKHSKLLLECQLKTSQVERFGWHLPDEKQLYIPVTAMSEKEISEKVIRMLLPLAESGRSLASLPAGFHFDAEQLIRTYESQLVGKGLMSKTGTQRRLRNIAKGLIDFVEPLRVIPEFQRLPQIETQATSQITRLLYQPRSSTHPLRHLVLIAWLFGSWNEFWHSYHQTLEKPVPNQEKETLNKKRHDPNETRRREFLALVNQGLAVSTAAKRIGVDPATGMAWAAAKGIATSSRAKLLKVVKRKGAIKLLQRGIDKAVVAEKYEVSVTTITKLMRSEPGLQDAWHAVRKEQARLAARKQWITAKTKNPLFTIKMLRLLEPVSYAWLYRNDWEWLGINKPVASK